MGGDRPGRPDHPAARRAQLARYQATGIEDLIEVAVEDYDESRRLTDDAITELGADLATRGTAAEAVCTRRPCSGWTRSSPSLPTSTAAPTLPARRAVPTRRSRTRSSRATRRRSGRSSTPPIGWPQPCRDGDPRRGTELVNLSSRQIETLSALARLLLVTGTVGGGVDASDEIDRIVELEGDVDAGGRAGPRHRPLRRGGGASTSHEFVAEFTDMADRALAGEAVDIDELPAPFEVPAADQLRTFRVAMADELIAAADTSQADARHRDAFLAMSLATLAAAFGFTWLASRSITGPCACSRQAKAMATAAAPAVSQVLQTPLGEDVVVPGVEPVRVYATRRPSPERSPRCRTPPTWRSSRWCCGATSPTAS